MSSKLSIARITSKEEVQKALGENRKLVVLEFMVAWSELYKFMIPAVKDLAERYKPYADFYTLDVDKLKEYAREEGVEVLPTFVVYKDGEERKRIVGIKKDELERSIVELKGEPVPEPSASSNIQEVPKTTTDCIIL